MRRIEDGFAVPYNTIAMRDGFDISGLMMNYDDVIIFDDSFRAIFHFSRFHVAGSARRQSLHELMFKHCRCRCFRGAAEAYFIADKDER